MPQKVVLLAKVKLSCPCHSLVGEFASWSHQVLVLCLQWNTQNSTQNEIFHLIEEICLHLSLKSSQCHISIMICFFEISCLFISIMKDFDNMDIFHHLGTLTLIYCSIDCRTLGLYHFSERWLGLQDTEDTDRIGISWPAQITNNWSDVLTGLLSWDKN